MRPRVGSVNLVPCCGLWLLCDDCMVAAHERNPLHPILVSIQLYFVDLSDFFAADMAGRLLGTV